MSNCTRTCPDSNCCQKIRTALFFWRCKFATWRKLTLRDHAHLFLHHTQRGLTHRELVIDYQLSKGSVNNYLQEALDAINDLDSGDFTDLADVVVIDGSLLETFKRKESGYSGKHKRHGMNIQAMVDLNGNLLTFSPVLTGNTHDSKAIREHGWVDLLKEADIFTIADSGYQGLNFWVPRKKRRNQERTEEDRVHNQLLAKFRYVVETVFAKLKKWRVLQKFRARISSLDAYVNAIRLLTWME